MATSDHVTMQLRDRPEFASKPPVLTFGEDATVREAVAAMSAKNYGAGVVVDAEDKVIGIVTERDFMKKVLDGDRDPATTRLGEIMSREMRMARETDDVLDWLRIMSNERFRRLPVVDEAGRIKAIFTQGDFVSYTWPDLMYQAGNLARATIGRNWAVVLIVGGVLVYSILMLLVFGVVL